MGAGDAVPALLSAIILEMAGHKPLISNATSLLKISLLHARKLLTVIVCIRATLTTIYHRRRRYCKAYHECGAVVLKKGS
jgi:hypothetical protein